MCEVLNVPRSSCYRYSSKTDSNRCIENTMYEKEILKFIAKVKIVTELLKHITY